MTQEDFIRVWRLGYITGFRDGIDGRIITTDEEGKLELFNDKRMLEDWAIQQTREAIEKNA